MRKGICLLFLCLSLLTLCSFDANQQKVYDEADLLTEDQEESLQEEAVELAEESEMDVVMVTTDDTGNLNTSQYNEEFYNSHSFGYEGPGGSGIQFLIDMEHRQYYLLTAGEGDTRYTDAEIEKIYDRIAPAMEEGDYADACSRFLEAAERYAGDGRTLSWGIVVLILAASAAFAAVTVAAVAWVNKKTVEGTWRRSYMGNRVHMNRQQDRFTHTTVVRTPVPKPKSGSGGGHGGGGHGGGGHGGGGHSRGGGRSF